METRECVIYLEGHARVINEWGGSVSSWGSLPRGLTRSHVQHTPRALPRWLRTVSGTAGVSAGTRRQAEKQRAAGSVGGSPWHAGRRPTPAVGRLRGTKRT